jgi:hypothetical protein
MNPVANKTASINGGTAVDPVSRRDDDRVLDRRLSERRFE